MTATGLALATIVLVHGLGGDRHAWDDVQRRLERGGARVLAVELPGHGENLPGPKAPSIDAAARQVAARIRQAHAAPAIVVGHSLGGLVAAHVPLVDRDAVEALVVVDMLLGPTWTDAEIAEMKRGLAADRERTLRGWFGAICQPAQLDTLLVGLRKLSNETLVGWMQAMKDGAVPDGGRAIGVPTLLMATAALVPGKKPRAEELAALGYAHVARLQVETFDKSRHWIMWDEPDKFVATLQTFARSLDAGAGR
ncbi:MAG TPA: alpha/beta hydrolase [Polyangia bacterium]